MLKKKSLLMLAMVGLVLVFTGCAELLVEDETPTKDRMEGTWKVTAATDVNDSSFLNQISIPLAAFHLSSDGTIISTAGPMWMYIVYGDNEYTKIASIIDQVFNYIGTDFNGGEFAVGGGVVERFTIEIKLEGLPGQKALTDLLDLIGIGNAYLDVVIYHKFLNVSISFHPATNDTMYWEFDDVTTAKYNKKDDNLEYVLWHGWPTDSFTRCKFTLARMTKDLKTLVEEANQ